VRYFIWAYEQDTSAHEMIQGKIMYRYFFIISARVGFMDFHTKKYQEMTRWSSFLGRDAQNFILNFYDFYTNVYGFLKFN
jgi:hypothetical protein